MNWQDFVNFTTQYTNQLIASPFFHQSGLLVLFVYVALPLDILPVPLEAFIIPLIIGKVDIQEIFLIAWAGEIVGSVGLYYLAKHGFRFITKREPKPLDKSHFLHKYRFLFFSFAPVFYFTGDAMMIVAGVKHMKIDHFIIPLAIGIFFRTLIAIVVSLGIVNLPAFLR